MFTGEVGVLVRAVCDADPWSRDLAESNPALFALLVFHVLETGQLTSLPRLAARRRRDILAMVGGVPADATERALRRCRFSRLGEPEILVLRALVAENHSWLHHLDAIHVEAATLIPYSLWPVALPLFERLLADHPLFAPQARNGGLLSAAARPFLIRVADDMRDIICELSLRSESRRDIPAIHEVGKLRRCRNLEDLARLQEELKDHNKHIGILYKMAEAQGWPAPPLPGNPIIEPVASARELVAEGLSMHHCVMEEAWRIFSGGAYIYRMLAPERATFMISKDGTRWRLRDVRLVLNKQPSPETMKLINDWLAAAGAEHRRQARKKM